MVGEHQILQMLLYHEAISDTIGHMQPFCVEGYLTRFQVILAYAQRYFLTDFGHKFQKYKINTYTSTI